MSFKRVALFISCLLLALGGALAAHAKNYPLIGGGGQEAIGQGLPLPAQVFTPGVHNTKFPPLLVPVRTTGTPPVIVGTTIQTTRQKLTVPPSVLKINAAPRIVGLNAQNDSLYAVQTDLGWAWPKETAYLSTDGRKGADTVTYVTLLVGEDNNNIRYQAMGNGKFGGPARFAISYGGGAGWVPNSPVTIFGVLNQAAGQPPCTHTALAKTGDPFPNPVCIAIVAGAWPANTGAIGATTNLFTYTTPVTNPNPGRIQIRAGANPKGTIISGTWSAMNGSGFTNQASSVGYPWTVGQIFMSAPGAEGFAEKFTITGKDNRTPGGSGTIQLVAGSLSQRNHSGPNGNRGWIRLVLGRRMVPTMSPAGIAAAAGLMLLAVGYVVRRRLS